MASTNASEKTSPVEIIYEGGDAILVVGPSKARMLVFSTLLIRTSTIFRGLFSGSFLEAQHLSVQSPPDIDLPEADAASLSILCHVLHGNNAAVPGSLSIDELLKLGRLVDMYNCREHFKLFLHHWIFETGPGITDVSFEIRFSLATVCYLFGASVLFRRITGLITYDNLWSDDEIFKAAHRNGTFDVVGDIIKSLGFQRRESHDKLEKGLRLWAKTLCYGDRPCAFAKSKIDAVNEALTVNRPFEALFTGVTMFSNRDIVSRLKAVPTGDWTESVIKECNGFHVRNIAAFGKLWADAESTCRGLCLECLQEGRSTSSICTNHEKADELTPPEGALRR